MGRDRGRRGPCRVRGRAGGGAHGLVHAHADDEPRRHRPDVVQSRRRRDGEGPPGPRDRRARRRDGPRRRPRHHPVPDAQCLARPRRPLLARAVRPRPLPRRDEAGDRAHAGPRPPPGAGESRAGRGRPRGRRGGHGRRALSRPRGGRDGGDVPAGPDSRRAPAGGGGASGRVRGRAPVGLPPRPGPHARAAQDGDLPAAARLDDRLWPARGTVGRSRALAVSLGAFELPASSGRLSHHPHDRSHPCGDRRQPRPLAALLRRDRSGGRALLSLHRGQDSPIPSIEIGIK